MNTQINLHLVNEGSNIDRVVLINGENDEHIPGSYRAKFIRDCTGRD